jgi:hypothetical protein
MVLRALVARFVEAHEKTLIVSANLADLDYVERPGSLPRGARVCRIDGTVKRRERVRRVEAFNHSDDCNVMLLALHAGGVGLNLQGASRVVVVHASYTPGEVEQAIKRSYRLGQEAPVFVYHLLADDTFDGTIFHHFQLRKAQGVAALVDNTKMNKIFRDRRHWRSKAIAGLRGSGLSKWRESVGQSDPKGLAQLAKELEPLVVEVQEMERIIDENKTDPGKGQGDLVDLTTEDGDVVDLTD